MGVSGGGPNDTVTEGTGFGLESAGVNHGIFTASYDGVAIFLHNLCLGGRKILGQYTHPYPP